MSGSPEVATHVKLAEIPNTEIAALVANVTGGPTSVSSMGEQVQDRGDLEYVLL